MKLKTTYEPTHKIETDELHGLIFKVELATGLKTLICFTCSKPLPQGWFSAGWVNGPRGSFDTMECSEAWIQKQLASDTDVEA